MAVIEQLASDPELLEAYRDFQESQYRLRRLEDKEFSSPFPQWLKSEDFTMIYINPAYEHTFDVTQEQYHGNEDYDVWPDHVASKFRAHDEHVLNTGERLEVIETVPHPETGEDWPLYVIKYPVQRNGFRGVGGTCIPVDWVEHALNK
jgi:PAS domain-containing protein